MNYKKIINMVKLYNSCLKRICDEYKIKFIDINYIINKTSKKGIYIDDKSHDALSKYLINKILQPDDKEYELQKKII